MLCFELPINKRSSNETIMIDGILTLEGCVCILHHTIIDIQYNNKLSLHKQYSQIIIILFI